MRGGQTVDEKNLPPAGILLVDKLGKNRQKNLYITILRSLLMFW